MLIIAILIALLIGKLSIIAIRGLGKLIGVLFSAIVFIAYGAVFLLMGIPFFAVAIIIIVVCGAMSTSDKT